VLVLTVALADVRSNNIHQLKQHLGSAQDTMTLVDEILEEAGFSKIAIEAVKSGKLHYGGSLDAASDKELSVKLAFHLKAELDGAKEIFLASPKKKEYDPTVESLGEFSIIVASNSCSS